MSSDVPPALRAYSMVDGLLFQFQCALAHFVDESGRVIRAGLSSPEGKRLDIRHWHVSVS